MEYELLQEIDAHYLLEYLKDLNDTVNTWKMKIFDVYSEYKDIEEFEKLKLDMQKKLPMKW